jgi:hypothetical protein
MLEHAAQLGANAVVGARYDANRSHARCDRSSGLRHCGLCRTYQDLIFSSLRLCVLCG